MLGLRSRSFGGVKKGTPEGEKEGHLFTGHLLEPKTQNSQVLMLGLHSLLDRVKKGTRLHCMREGRNKFHQLWIFHRSLQSIIHVCPYSKMRCQGIPKLHEAFPGLGPSKLYDRGREGGREGGREAKSQVTLASVGGKTEVLTGTREKEYQAPTAFCPWATIDQALCMGL